MIRISGKIHKQNPPLRARAHAQSDIRMGTNRAAARAANSRAGYAPRARGGKHFARVAAAVLAAVLAALPLSGCLQYRELKAESIVVGMGIDADSSGGYLVTFQIYKPQQNGGGGDSSKGGSSSQVTILQSNGSSIFDAVRNATLQVGRFPYFSNNRAYVLGAEVCRANLAQVMDFMQRNEQINPSEHIFMATGKASDILTYEKNGEIVPATNLDMMVENHDATSFSPAVRLVDVYRVMATGVTDVLLPLLAVKTNNDKSIVMLDGSAAFRGGNLAGTLNPDETRGVLWVTGKVKGGVLNLPLQNGGIATMEIYKAGSKTETGEQNGVPVVRVNISLNTGLASLRSVQSITIGPALKSYLIARQNALVREEAEAAVGHALKGYGADVFGFGMKMFENEPELWRKISTGWAGSSKTARVEITVHSDISHFGSTTQLN